MSRTIIQIPDPLHKNLRLRSALTGRPQYRIVLDALAIYLANDDEELVDEVEPAAVEEVGHVE